MEYLIVFIILWLIVLTIVVMQIRHQPPGLAERLRAANEQLENAIKPKQEEDR